MSAPGDAPRTAWEVDAHRTPRLRSILERARVLPILTIEEADAAVPLATALAEGGLSVLEITLRTEAAYEAIERVASALPEVVVGAGTVLRAEQMAAAEAAGARFAVSPGLTDELTQVARRSRLPLLPGVATVTEAIAAAGAGFEVLKLFPARTVGGVAFLQAVRGPLPELAFCPTGGIDHTSYRELLAQPNVVCVGGSWMISATAVENRRWSTITRLAAGLR